MYTAKWGSFDGAGAIERAHAAFMRGEIDETGVMIHYVSSCPYISLTLTLCITLPHPSPLPHSHPCPHLLTHPHPHVHPPAHPHPDTNAIGYQVIAQVDRGDLLLQEIIPLHHPDDDDIAKVEARIHSVEHRLIVRGTGMALEALGRRQREVGP